MLRVAVVHNEVPARETDPAARDILDQADFVCRALKETGHLWRRYALGDNTAWLERALKEFKARLVFNLVEAVGGDSARHPEAAALWAAWGLPHTGAGAAALALTTDKAATRRRLAEAGLPVPPGAVVEPDGPPPGSEVPGPWIVKPATEDASIGIDEDSVARDRERLAAAIAACRRRCPGRPVLVERFLAGREFNLSLLAGQLGPAVLPAAEMIFADYPPGKERVVGWRAKWSPDSFEGRHTRRRFDFPAGDAPLLATLKELALKAWTACGLAGYARVDLRLDEAGRPFILEVNANPCLAPDAGFVAAAARAGLGPAPLVDRILAAALRPVGAPRRVA